MKRLSRLLCLILLTLACSSTLTACGKTYTVSFDLNGRAEAIESIVVKQGEKITRPDVTSGTCTHISGTIYNLLIEKWFNGEKVWDFDNDIVESDVTLKAKWTFEDSFFLPKENADVRAENTDVRVMSFNVLSATFNYNRPVEPTRSACAINTINRYKPDIIGVQEFDDDWYLTVEENLNGYAIVNTDNKQLLGTTTNFSTLIYNTSTLKVIEYTQERLFSSDNPNCRNVTIACFEKLSDGKRFIAASTHFNLNQAGRKIQYNHLYALVEKMMAIYPNVPIILTGDFNSNQISEEYSAFTSSYTFTSASNAQSKGLTCKTTHLGNGMRVGELDNANPDHWLAGKISFLPENIETENCIDHIFISNTNITSLYYSVIVDEDALTASDHCPIYADVKFN